MCFLKDIFYSLSYTIQILKDKKLIEKHPNKSLEIRKTL